VTDSHLVFILVIACSPLLDRTTLFDATCVHAISVVGLAVSDKVVATTWQQFQSIYILTNSTTAPPKPRVC
jgi:hypothetical protein